MDAFNDFLGYRELTKAGEKGVINLTKWVPILGGIVGGIVDKGTSVVGYKYGGKMSVNNVFNMYKIANATKGASTEIYGRAHDLMTVADKNISQNITEQFNDWKNSKVENMYTNYYNKNKGE